MCFAGRHCAYKGQGIMYCIRSTFIIHIITRFLWIRSGLCALTLVVPDGIALAKTRELCMIFSGWSDWHLYSILNTLLSSDQDPETWWIIRSEIEFLLIIIITSHFLRLLGCFCAISYMVCRMALCLRRLRKIFRLTFAFISFELPVVIDQYLIYLCNVNLFKKKHNKTKNLIYNPNRA